MEEMQRKLKKKVMKKIFTIFLLILSLSSFSQAKWHLVDEYTVKDSVINNVKVDCFVQIFSGSNNRLVFAVALNGDTTILFGQSLIVVPKDCEFAETSDCNKVELSTVFPVLHKGEKLSLIYRSRQEIKIKKTINIKSGEKIIFNSEGGK